MCDNLDGQMPRIQKRHGPFPHTAVLRAAVLRAFATAGPATLNGKLRRISGEPDRTGEEISMSKHEEADLILKLYDLRREPTMRIARDYFFRDFNPKSMEDIGNVLMGEHSGHIRMVVSYWDMAAALVNHGAIDVKLFNDTNGEHLGVFTKMEPFLGEIRDAFGPQFLANLEKLVDATPDGRKRVAEMRERMKNMRAAMSQSKTQTAARG